MLRQWFAAVSLSFAALCASHLYGASLEGSHGAIRVEINGSGPTAEETILAKIGDAWVSTLSATSSPIRVKTATETKNCVLLKVSPMERGLLLTGDCGVGQFERRITLSSEDDVLNVSTRLTLKAGAAVDSVEDRYDFVPERRSTDNTEAGPLDFVWSQNIKSEVSDLIPA